MNDDIENLDRLADELEGLRVDTPAPGLSRLEPWLRMVADRGASDLLLVAGEPPALRVNGRIARTDFAPMDGVDIEEMVLPELPPHAQRAYRDAGLADAARKVPGIGRFRINLHHERGRAAAAIRMLPAKVPLLASLDLPAGTEALARLPRGLVIVGGATGSGKTTTLAALVDEINRRECEAHHHDRRSDRVRAHQPARASSSRSRSASTRRTFRRRCDRRSARRPTSSSSARCAIRRRCASRWRRARRATSC